MAHLMGISWCYETFKLRDINLFMKSPIQKSCSNIHLVDVIVMNCGQGK
jgi:hypothetical protein